MARVITVKGTGKASAKPDFVVISMSLHTRDRNYDTGQWIWQGSTSNTQYRVAEESLPYAAAPTAINIEPDDIDVSDTVTFVWEIES